MATPSVHRKQPLTEGIHGEMDLLGARALQGAVLKRGCACGVCFLIGQFLFGRCHGSVVGDYVINLCSSIEHSQVDV